MMSAVVGGGKRRDRMVGRQVPSIRKKTSVKFRDFKEQYIRSVLTIWTYDLFPYKITLLPRSIRCEFSQ